MILDQNKRSASRLVLLAFVFVSIIAVLSTVATPAGAAGSSIMDSVGGFLALASGKHNVYGFGRAQDKVNTTTEITGDTPDPSLVGESYNVSWQVTENVTSEFDPTGTVTVTDGTDSCIAAVEAGSCSLTSTTNGPKSLQATYSGDDNFNGSTSPTVSHTVVRRVNWAYSLNGGIATASSESSLATAANDGNRTWAVGGSWKDATPGVFPDILQIALNGVRMVDEISIFAVRDDFNNTTPPDETTTTSTYSLVDFDVQYFDGVEWKTVPNGEIRGNNLAWVRLTFPELPAAALRLVIYNASTDGFSRVVELEAWGNDATGPAPSPTATAEVSPTATVEPSPTATATVQPSPTATAEASPTATVDPSPTASVDPSPTPTVGPTPPLRTNHASKANGGTATGSTELTLASAANDGNRTWAVGGAWKDTTPGAFPDTLQITFNGSKEIDEISVFAVLDDFSSTTPPSETTTTTQFSLIDFDVQYFDGETWITLPGGMIRGNNLAWVRLTFPLLSTTAVRIVVHNASADGYTRVVEFEAWGPAPEPSPVPTATATVQPTATATPTATPTATATATPSVPMIRKNHALAANGATAAGSTELNPASNAINGSRVWANGGAWKDNDPGVFPDTLTVNFNGTQTIDEISIFAVLDDFMSTTPPDLTTTTSQYSLTDFDVQYWNGSAWVTVPGGTITGNNKAWVKLTFAPISTNAIRVVVHNAAVDGYSRIVELEAFGDVPAPPVPTVRVNHALASNGGVAAGSTEMNPAANAINGSRVWANGGAWKDNDPGIFPDTLQVNFSGTKEIDEISVFAVLDDFMSTTPPDQTTTTSQYSLIAFEVQYWNGSAWVTVPGGVITGNNKAWVKLTFAPITTSAIRVIVNNAALDGHSRIVELEAFGSVPVS